LYPASAKTPAAQKDSTPGDAHPPTHTAQHTAKRAAQKNEQQHIEAMQSKILHLHTTAKSSEGNNAGSAQEQCKERRKEVATQ